MGGLKDVATAEAAIPIVGVSGRVRRRAANPDFGRG